MRSRSGLSNTVVVLRIPKNGFTRSPNSKRLSHTFGQVCGKVKNAYGRLSYNAVRWSEEGQRLTELIEHGVPDKALAHSFEKPNRPFLFGSLNRFALGSTSKAEADRKVSFYIPRYLPLHSKR